METIDGTQPASMVPHSAQRLKILVLFDTLNIANDNCTAGASSRQLRVNAELLAMGHDVRFILGDVGCHYDGWSRWPFWSALLRYDQIHQDPFRIIDALGSWTPDIVVSTNSHEVLAYGRLVADALEARLVFEVHDNDRELMAMVGADTDDLVLAETLQVQAARSADIVLTISPAERTSWLLVVFRPAESSGRRWADRRYPPARKGLISPNWFWPTSAISSTSPTAGPPKNSSASCILRCGGESRPLVSY